MALFTFHVSAGGKSYVTQLRADDWGGAKKALVESGGFREFSEEHMPSTIGAPLAEADVFLMVPMTGLKHCWWMQGGRSGEYFGAVVIRTDDDGDVEDPCDVRCVPT